jgi:cysteinyl-tRNA synthetase
MQFYDSRKSSIVPFTHNPSIPVNIYTCGPTVYDEVHLGNLKTFLWSDFIVSVLKASGYETNHIMNITDIDDKIIKRLPEQTKESLIAFTTTYTDLFLDSLTKLGVRNYTKHNIHRVTDYVEEIKHSVQVIVETGHGYVTRDGSVYFDTASFTGTNPFASVTDVEDDESARTIIRAEDVRSKKDFALWKAKPEEDVTLHWNLESVRGAANGRMGWHIECSSIARRALGKVHIKMGGSDLKHIHHAAEIYQSECLGDEVYGDYWIHFGFLNFGGEKMSKSLGNVMRLSEIEAASVNLKLLRLYLLSKSYKNDTDFNLEDIQDGSYLKKNFMNLHLLYNKLKYAFYKSEGATTSLPPLYPAVLKKLQENFDTVGALKLLFEYVNVTYKMKLNAEMERAILDELNKVNDLFNILDPSLLTIDVGTLALVSMREAHRAAKQFAEADLIRLELHTRYVFEDDKTGFSLVSRF